MNTDIGLFSVITAKRRDYFNYHYTKCRWAIDNGFKFEVCNCDNPHDFKYANVSGTVAKIALNPGVDNQTEKWDICIYDELD